MVSFKIAVIMLLGVTGDAQEASTFRSSSSSHRRLSSFESIAGYEPRSLVTDHNAIDLDQAAMAKQLALATTQSYAKARGIYTDGAFSKSIAKVTLYFPLGSPLNADTAVTGKTEHEFEVAGSVLRSYQTGTTVIEIRYKTDSVQGSYVGCQVGANPNPNTVGCFAASGQLAIEGEGTNTTFDYSYAPLSDNINMRTIQGFSKHTEHTMLTCANCPYLTYNKFNQYYGEFDYADKWVSAAFDGKATDFANGNADFSTYGFDGRTEAIKKGTAVMTIWMHIIRQLEDALDGCKEGCEVGNCNEGPVHGWDSAVAFYSGSLESTDRKGSGVLMHQLADKLCTKFNTCGDFATWSGMSQVNIALFYLLQGGQRKLLQGRCSAARANKERIEQLMAVPLVQGTLQYAYITNFDDYAGEKAEAAGAVFAASVLPLVHACNEKAARTIYDSMRTGQNGDVDFIDVKDAFESAYSCLGIRCEDIGGLYDSAAGDYFEHASPCGTQTMSSKDKANVGRIVVATIGSMFLLATLVFIYHRLSSQKSEIAVSSGCSPENNSDTGPEAELKAEGAIIA